jgi:hypothetical protein
MQALFRNVWKLHVPFPHNEDSVKRIRIGSSLVDTSEITLLGTVNSTVMQSVLGLQVPDGVIVFAHLGFEFLRVVVMKSPVFWHIKLCGPMRVNARFGGTCRLHLQCWWRQARNKQDVDSCLLHAGFLLGLLCNLEYGGEILLRNVGWLSANYTVFCRGR